MSEPKEPSIDYDETIRQHTEDEVAAHQKIPSARRQLDAIAHGLSERTRQYWILSQPMGQPPRKK